MADRDLPRQRQKRRGDDLPVAGPRFGGDDEVLAVLQLVDALDVADADLRALDVAHDRHVAADVRGHVADRADGLLVLLVRAVGEVEAEDVHPRGEQACDDLLGARGRTEGGDDLGSAHGRRRRIHDRGMRAEG